MSGIEENPSSSPSTLGALNNDIVVEEIISYLGPNLHDLINYRLVCHKWNDLIVRKINKSGPSLPIPLRYGPEIPQIITKANARRWAQETLENVSNTLTGTASRLLFDTVIVDRDFYLAGVVFKWKCFLEAHGESIRHLKFKLRSHELPKLSENHVTDCEEIMSMKDLVSTFSATPNLESLYFSIRFSNYLPGPVKQPKPIVLGNLPFPKLHKLTNITIREPNGISYSDILLTQILGMAPNLTTLCIKPSSLHPTRTAALNSISKDVIQSLTSLKISNAHILGFNDPRNMIYFSYLHLTTLELNNISGMGRHDWIDKLLLAQHNSLVNLILGDRKCSHPLLRVQDITPTMTPLCFVTLPPVMERLKLLEVNLSKCLPFRDDSYEIQFPALESLTLSGARENGNGNNKWRSDHVTGLLRLGTGLCRTLKQFSLIGPIHALSRSRIIIGLHTTFPMAECHFHSESDHQCSQEMQRVISLYGARIREREGNIQHNI